MNSRELIVHALLGAPIDRFPCSPLAVHYTAILAGVSVRDYTTNAQTLADCVVKYYEQFKPDALWISADTWVTAQAMGAEVGFISDDQPMCGIGEPLIKTASDIDEIPAVNTLCQGRFPLMCQALSIVKKRVGDEVFIVGCFDQSPFSLACALMGMESMMMKLIDDPDFVEALLDRCIEYASAYGISLAKAGADMLSTGDSPAGLIGEKLYREIALPAEQKVFASIRQSCDALLSLHICGNASHILIDMARAGCDVLEIDSNVDIEQAIEKVGNDVALWGNIDPVAILEQGTLQLIESQTRKLLNTIKKHDRTRFVLSSGCTLAPGTPDDNVHMLIETARSFKR